MSSENPTRQRPTEDIIQLINNARSPSGPTTRLMSMIDQRSLPGKAAILWTHVIKEWRNKIGTGEDMTDIQKCRVPLLDFFGYTCQVLASDEAPLAEYFANTQLAVSLLEKVPQQQPDAFDGFATTSGLIRHYSDFNTKWLESKGKDTHAPSDLVFEPSEVSSFRDELTKSWESRNLVFELKAFMYAVLTHNASPVCAAYALSFI